MKSCFPYEYYDLFEMSDVVAIKSNIQSRFIAYLTKDTLFIHDSYTLKHELTSKYTRSEESITNIGSNHWLQWITQNEIAFGTCTGNIFISKISEDGIISEPITTEIKSVITSTFSGNKMLGLCLSSMNVLFIDNHGKIRANVHINEQGCGIRSAYFYEPSLLVGVINDRPFRVQLTKNVLSREEKPQVSFMPVKGVLSIVQSISQSLIAITRERGNLVIALQQSEANGADIQITKEGEDVNELIYTEFSLDGSYLYSFTRNGDIIIWNSSTSIINRINLSILRDATCIEFDNQRRRAFFSANGHIHLIEFITFSSFIGSTQRSVYLLSASSQCPSKKIFSFEENNFYDVMYPLSGATAATNNIIILYNKKGFFVHDIETKESTPIVKINVSHIGSIMNTIVVLSKSDSSSLGFVAAFFDLNGKELKWFPLEHAPLTMQICRNKIVITSNTKYTVIKLDLERIDSRYIVVGNNTIYVNIKTYSTTEQIKDAVSNEKSKDLILYVNGVVKIFSNKEHLDKEVSKIWYESSTDMVVMVKPQEYAIFFNGGIFRFKGCALFSDGTYLYSIYPKMELGKLLFRCDDVFPFLIDPAINDEESFCRAVKHFEHSTAFSTLLARAVIHEVKKNKFNALFSQMKLFDSKSIAAIMNSFSLMADDTIKKTVVNANFDWSSMFEFSDKETQQMVLKFIDGQYFLNFMEKEDVWKEHLKPNVIEDFVYSSVKENKFKKGLCFSCDFEIDMQKLTEKCEKTKEMDMKELIDAVFTEFEQLVLPASMLTIMNQQIRYFCSLLISNGNAKLAFALLLSNEDSKKLALLIAMSDEIAEEAKTINLESQKAKNILIKALNLL